MRDQFDSLCSDWQQIIHTASNSAKLLLLKQFGDDLHWYGYENKTKDKIEGIGSYKYHLVLENQLGHNSMTFFKTVKIYY